MKPSRRGDKAPSAGASFLLRGVKSVPEDGDETIVELSCILLLYFCCSYINMYPKPEAA